MTQPQLDSSLLSAALQGLESQRHRIEEHIAHVKSMLGGTATPRITSPTEAEPRRRRKFSAATRRKMALAQKRRYAALRGGTVPEQSAATKGTAKPTKPKKRKMSTQGLANIRAGVRKRLAAQRKQAAHKIVTGRADSSLHQLAGVIPEAKQVR